MKRLIPRTARECSERSYNCFFLNDHIVRTNYYDEDGAEHFWDIYLENVFWGGVIDFPIGVEKHAQNRIIWIHELSVEEYQKTGEYATKGGTKGIICIYSTDSDSTMKFVLYSSLGELIRSLVLFKHSDEHVNFSKNYMKLFFCGAFKTKYSRDLRVLESRIIIDDNNSQEIPCKMNHKGFKKRLIYRLHIEEIVSKETAINNPIRVSLRTSVNSLLAPDITCNESISLYNLGKHGKRNLPSKFNFVPVASVYYKDWALAVRKNICENYSLVVRRKDPVEYSEEFLKLENKFNSFCMYHIGHIKRRFHRKPVNLYFEKNSMKAEEGTYEVFLNSLHSDTSLNFFILDKSSPQWEELSQNENVIRKYSKRYYKLLYEADCFISTETTSHLNVHRAINKYVRKTLIEKKFVFLQHGITYLKCQGDGSVFGKGKEGEPDYIVVDSEAESAAVSRMLKIPEERCVIAGLPIFSTIEYKHITEASDDIAIIMLTWKPSEEHLLYHFEDTTYFKNVSMIYEELLKYLPKEKILIVPHPKVYEHMMSTSLRDSVWNREISEALKIGKLLITDYSSACYNAFYQGAAVMFYQPDLESYEQEVGKLVLKDDEYIGHRSLCFDDFSKAINMGLNKGYIDKGVLRTQSFEEKYIEINKFNDGKNVERITDFLREKGFV